LAQVNKSEGGVRIHVRGIGLKVMWEKQRTDTLLPPPQSEEAEFYSALPTGGPWLEVAAGASSLRCGDVMISHNCVSLILRRLDEIERKLDRMLEELQTSTAILNCKEPAGTSLGVKLKGDS